MQFLRRNHPLQNQTNSEDLSATGRISVLRDRHLVPLLTSPHSQSSAEQPWKGVLLESHLVQPGEIPQHEHPDLVLHLQLTGSDDFEWWSAGKNAIEQTRPGSMILIPPGTSDRLRWRGPSERLIVSVRQSDLAHLANDLGVSGTPEFTTNWSFRDLSTQHLVTEMGRETRSGFPLGSLYADLLAIGLQTQLFKSHAVDPLKTPALKGGINLPKLKRAMEYINTNLAEDLHLESIANELDLSASHFAHEFRNTTGQTPYQYLLDQRMAKAKDLLRRTHLPVQYISASTGFSSSANFVRTFRQRIGLTPEAWRRNQ
jgi:AraC family transcriptional regulator